VHTNFALVSSILRDSTIAMLEGLRTGLQHDTLGVLPNKNDINPFYPLFEIFFYLLFQLDFLVVAYQEDRIRKPLFNYVADDILDVLDITDQNARRSIDNVINKRMTQYGGIQADGNLTDDSRRQKLIKSFAENLAYSVSKQTFFDWDAKSIITLPFTDANQVLVMHIIYGEVLLPVELRFRITIRNLLAANSDVTQLSIDDIDRIQEASLEEIDETGL